MVGANGSALPIYEHEQPHRLNDHHLPRLDRENDPVPHSQKAITSPPRRSKAISPSRGPKPLLPRSLKEALQLASLLSKSKLVPKGFENPEACLVGILYGMEVGLSPIAALQRMAIIEGRPTIWGDAALALVEASGLLIKIEERIEILGSKTDEQSSDWPNDGKATRTGQQRPDQSDERQNTKTRTAICQVLRSGRSEPIIRSFSVEDAKRAGLWQKPGPWTDYPDRMLMMRARAFALRDAFPDVLAGLYLREEFEGVEAETRYAKPELGSGSDSIDSQTELDGEDKSYLRSNNQQDILEPATFCRPSQSNSRSSIRRAPPPPPIEVETPAPSKPENQPITLSEDLDKKEDFTDLTESEEAVPYQSASDILELFDSALACAKDEETLEEIREEFTERIDRLDSAGLQEAGRIFLRHEKRIKATEEAFKTSCEPSEEPIAREPSILRPEEYESEDEADDQLEDSQSNLLTNATGRIGKETLSPHRRRRFSIRLRKGLSLAELNARRKVDFLKYMPRFRKNEDETDE